MHIQHVTHVFKSDMLKRHIADAYASHLEYTHDNAYATCRVIRVAGPSICRGISNIICYIICVTSYMCMNPYIYTGISNIIFMIIHTSICTTRVCVRACACVCVFVGE